MEQTKALNALEPFLALQKTASSPLAAAELITRATSAPHTYLFAELLHTPAAQSLASHPKQAPYLALLRVFSYGTYADYLAAPAGSLPPLTEQQALKLRQLSLLSLARDRRNLSYASLMAALDLASARELEDAVTSAVYAGLLDATMDPYRAVLQVHSVSPLRDLAPGSIPPMMEKLEAWSARCGDTLASLESEVESIKEKAALRQKEKAAAEAELKRLVDAKDGVRIGAGRGGRQRGGGKRGVEEGGEEVMDVDVDEEGGGKLRASRRKL
ncbi:related to ACOB protein [Cephalotrichum gorgonifer]|uniref:Related to ACOB protein n=1 Tax=Cephalotrichum gorgonifer TaxID=2041049 RepID=A0AAE8N987_9PEZI|nr:related to ACOB protein [Cephalotrichum gorgonifer]